MTNASQSNGLGKVPKQEAPETSWSSSEGKEEMLARESSIENSTCGMPKASSVPCGTYDGPQEELAFALAAQGIPVLPVNSSRKTPLVTRGFYDATTNVETIQSWWTKWPDARVGYWTGGANLVVLDLDEKKGISGLYEIESRELEYFSCIGYSTPSGGSHWVYKSKEGRSLRPVSNYLGLRGVDIRAGNSYAIWYGKAPESLEELPTAPDWLYKTLKPRTKATNSESGTTDVREAFGGDIAGWIDWLGTDEPWFSSIAIREAISRTNHIGHEELLRFVSRIHMCRLQGEDSLQPVLAELVSKFSQTTNNHDGWRTELENIIRWVIGSEWSPESGGNAA